MAQGIRELRRRIKSVQNTQKITKAMKLVAASKLKKAQSRAAMARPYADAMAEVLRAVGASVESSVRLPLLEKRPVVTRGYILISGDRGLSGPFNSALQRKAREIIGTPDNSQAFVVGRKGRDFFRKRGYPIISEYVMVGDDPSFELAASVIRDVIEAYVSGQVDEVHLIYTHYVSALTQKPVVEQLLPVANTADGNAPRHGPYLFEPDAESVLAELLPKYLETLVYSALLESKASEQSARMTAMDAATRNAGELIKRLTLVMNRARQAAITKEIAEIVGGAAALE